MRLAVVALAGCATTAGTGPLAALRVGGSERYAIGPELGIGPLGVELDTILTAESRGVAVRPFASLGVFAVALRVGNVEDEGWFGDLTVSLKSPCSCTDARPLTAPVPRDTYDVPGGLAQWESIGFASRGSGVRHPYPPRT